LVGVQQKLKSVLPNKVKLGQNYPNPFNPTTTIEFSIPKSEFVTLKIYNLLGQKVATLVNKKQQVGRYQVQWDASPASGGQGFPSGIYYYMIRSGDYRQVKKMLLVR
jgi:flagellar hook assembly protein FlgD